jgi:hypothetical protein
MNRGRGVWTAGVLICAALVCLAVIRGAPFDGCTPEALILTASQLSDDWHISDSDLWPAYLPEQDDLGAKEALRTLLENDSGGLVGHTVYRYRSSFLAVWRLWFDKQVHFPSACMKWETVPEIPGLSLQTDQFMLMCGTATCSETPDQCTAIVRYGNYVSELSLTVRGDTTSAEELVEFLVKIDNRVRLCRP